MFIWTIVALSILAGALIATQGPINAELSRLTGHPLSAAAMSSMMTASILLTLAVVSRAPMPEIGRLAAAPWWIVVGGGLIGVYGVYALLAFTPILGAASFIAAMISGMLIAAVVLDHFGFVGLEVRTINAWRLLGIGFLFTGVVLVRRF